MLSFYFEEEEVAKAENIRVNSDMEAVLNTQRNYGRRTQRPSKNFFGKGRAGARCSIL